MHSDRWVLDAAGAGFNLVMPSDPHAAYDDYVGRVKRIVHHCHERHVAVEGEIGELPCAASGRVEDAGQPTDPALAERFVSETGVDLLAVSAGNVHIHVSGEQDLDLDRLTAIHKRVPVPLVLHGGTGITADRSGNRSGSVSPRVGAMAPIQAKVPKSGAGGDVARSKQSARDVGAGRPCGRDGRVPAGRP